MRLKLAAALAFIAAIPLLMAPTGGVPVIVPFFSVVNGPTLHQNPFTFGSNLNAVSAGLVTNTTHPVQVMNFASDSAQANYATRDSVGWYFDNTCPAPVASAVAGTFTTTTFTPTVAFSAAVVAQFHVGMYAITQEAGTFYSGTISSWASNGSSLTVLAWYQQGNTAAGQTPTGGDTLTINPATKCWAANGVLTLPSNSIATQGAIMELDLNDLTATASTNTTWGIDINNLNAAQGQNAFQVRGAWGTGYRTNQTAGVGFRADGAYTSGFSFHASNFDIVGSTGQADFGSGTASQGNETLCLRDSGHATCDVILQSSGGTGANDGTLTFNATTVTTAAALTTTGALSAGTATVNGLPVRGLTTCTTACSIAGILVGQSWSVTGGSSTTRTSTTTNTVDANLQFTSVPLGTYNFSANLNFLSGGGGFRTNVTCAGVNGQFVGFSVAPLATTVIEPLSVDAQNTGAGQASISGTVEVTSGTVFGICWAQSSSNASASTLTSFSNLTITRVQ